MGIMLDSESQATDADHARLGESSYHCHFADQVRAIAACLRDVTLYPVRCKVPPTAAFPAPSGDSRLPDCGSVHTDIGSCKSRSFDERVPSNSNTRFAA